MSAKHEVPIDPLSRLPFPVILDEIVEYQPVVSSWHHHLFHAKDDRLTSIGGQAVRESYVQVMPTAMHNTCGSGVEPFHEIFKGSGDGLPENDDDCFDMTIPPIAGYVSAYGIDLHSSQNHVKLMTPAQRTILERPARAAPSYHRQAHEEGVYRRAERMYEALTQPVVSFEEYLDEAISFDRSRQTGFSRHHFSYNYPLARDFFWSYLLGKGTAGIEDKITDLLKAHDDDIQLMAGRMVLLDLVDAATRRIAEPYRQMYETGRLLPSAPKDVRDFVMIKLGGQTHRDHRMRCFVQQERKALSAAA